MTSRTTFEKRDAIIAVEGTFDTAAAPALRAAIRNAAAEHPATVVVVDFSRARDVTPAGLMALIEEYAPGAGAVRFRGLSQHQQRILRHLTGRGR
jgi:anti-anti-sigma regulatory factor